MLDVARARGSREGRAARDAEQSSKLGGGKVWLQPPPTNDTVQFSVPDTFGQYTYPINVTFRAQRMALCVGDVVFNWTTWERVE